MMDARAIPIVLMGLLAAVPALAAPAERRGFAIVSGRHKKLTKKQIVIVVSVVCGFIGLVLLGLIIFVIWVTFDIGEKIRDRILDWRMKRMVANAVDEVMKELEAMPASDPPSTTAATAQPNSSSALNEDGREHLVVPSSPKSKAATETSTQSENQQQAQQLPPYTETADITMPEPAYIQSQPDPNAPVPYTRGLPPPAEGRKT